MASSSFGFSLLDLKEVWTTLSFGWFTIAVQRPVLISDSPRAGRTVDQDVLPLKGFFKRTGYVDDVLVLKALIYCQSAFFLELWTSQTYAKSVQLDEPFQYSMGRTTCWYRVLTGNS